MMSLETIRKIPLSPGVETTFDAFAELRKLSDAQGRPLIDRYRVLPSDPSAAMGAKKLDAEKVSKEHFRFRINRIGPNIGSTHPIHHEVYAMGALAVRYNHTFGQYDEGAFTADSLSFGINDTLSRTKDHLTVLTTHRKGEVRREMIDYSDEFEPRMLSVYLAALQTEYHLLKNELGITAPSPEAITFVPEIPDQAPLAKVIPLRRRDQ